MIKRIEEYEEIAGEKTVNHIYEEAVPLLGKHILHINSTYQGGGVAEMLNSLVLLMNSIGIDAGWRILHGTPDFFEITKKFHNALQGRKINLSKMKKRIYLAQNENFSIFTHIDHDAVIVHDPQPLPMINFYGKDCCPWIWRCHIDVSQPWQDMWRYLKRFITKYDAMVVSHKCYMKKELKVPQHVIMPSIDPLSTKNEKITDRTISKYLSKNQIDRDKPIIAQISRFDRWKDPKGVVKVYKRVKKEVDCRLVLLGSFASDDPEGKKIYAETRKAALDDEDIIFVTNATEILVNSVQRAASVVLQKSLKEGFALTVSEALWKGTPVVASNIGGITLQVIDGENGYLVDPFDYKGCADRVIKLLKNPEKAKEMGQKGREHVKKNFLITRQLLDWLRLLRIYIH
ncbi:MAG TPA: glycosyltransferase [Thermoplasmata archaeon]|nr:glycosyltransferase [Thermoplasmata archaeon]